jgi:iron complex transport system ATP-binding protein
MVPFENENFSERPESPLLQGNNVGLARAGKQVFSCDSFLVHAGQRVALLGNNGAGKSSLLMVLAGVLRSEGKRGKGTEVTGAIAHSGRPLSLLSLHDRARAFAWLPQALWRDPHFHVNAFLSLNPRSFEENPVLMHTMRRCFDVDGLGLRRLDALSGGEWRRVQLAKTFGRGARLLLLDEPSAGLDLRHTGALRLAMEEHVGALVFSTHDLSLVAACATHVFVLDAGRLLFWGTFEEFRQGDVASRLFGVRVRWHKASDAGDAPWFPEVSS